ncbi:class I SAM-dependent methyltransferase [Stappia indica]|uniref:class I SAM-dependent methyltransferase n=1 Tax=Stappia indica TaxID=538381 RepID=UPI0011127529|nr:class I SAM-dependent methyltransferase [Stappia indica]
MREKMKTGQTLEAGGNCAVCDTRERRIVSLVGRGFQKLTTVICTGCGLVHSHPIPSPADLQRFYAEDYRKAYKGTHKPKLKHVYRYAPGAYQRVAELAALVGPEQRRFLDIGSGSGEILYMARKAGFEVTGVEPNTGYADYTREELGLPVQNCTFEEADLPKAHFDILNLSHVLEHLPDPLASLRFLNTLLRPGGILCVAVPDIGHASHAPWTRFHYAHIHNFSHETLKAMVLKAGFEILPQSSGSTTLIARKTGAAFCDMPRPMPENYEMLWQTLTAEHAGVAHVAGKRGIARLLGKLYRYPRDHVMGRLMGSPRRILDKVHARMCETYGTLMTFALAAV